MCQRVSAIHAKRLKVLEITGEQQKACVLSQGRYGYIGKARMSSLGHGCIRNLACQPGGLRIEWQDTVCKTCNQPVQPAVQPLGAFHTA